MPVPTTAIAASTPHPWGATARNVALPRILDTYRRFDLKQSFFIPGWCLEQYPDTAEAILKDGHEIGHHGYLHEDPITTYGTQREWFERTLEAHKRICGQIPQGYRAPVYNITDEVVDLMQEYGMRYDSSMMADDVPYAIETSKGQLYEMPVHWGTDDWPPFAHYEEIGYMMPVRPPAAALAGFWEEFEAQYEAGGFFMLILHPFLTGRLARWRLVEHWIEDILKTREVWFSTLAGIADHLDALQKTGVWSPSVEKLPYFNGPPAKQQNS